MKKILSALCITLLFAACEPKEEAVNIQELNQQFIGAWNSKEPDKVINLLADDVHFVQGDAHYSGKSEVSQKWVRETLPTLKDLRTSIISSSSDSQIAYQAGTFSVEVLPEAPNEPRGVGEGNFMLLWKKGPDKNWKLSYAQLEDLPVRVKQ